MSIKHEQASRKRWSVVPAEERSKRMAAIARIKAQKMTREQRLAIGKFLADARRIKVKIKGN